MKFFKKHVTNMMAASVLLPALLLSLTACGSDSGNDHAIFGALKDTEQSSGSAGTSESGSVDAGTPEFGSAGAETPESESKTEDAQYCDQADCHMMFPHIHISMDNWQEYFEFTTEFEFDSNGGFFLAETVFNLREEWRDKIKSHLVDVHYHVGYTEYSVSGEVDWDNRAVTVGENAEKVYSQHIRDTWYDTEYSCDENTGLTRRSHMASITNNKEKYDGTIQIWEPEMLEISDGAYIGLKED